jgi:MoaA/NifB/PqqE/SkfB family radical SAM enzyme
MYDGLESLLGESKSKRNKAAFQVMYYSYLYANDSGDDFDRIEPGIFNSRELFSGDFDWRIKDKSSGYVTNFMNIIDDFEDKLSDLLHEIWNAEIPFDQTEDVDTCKYCPYKGICHR